MRREDTTRKEAREKRKARKEEELAKKREEISRLKALKMRELRSKLERIGREGGKSLEEDAGMWRRPHVQKHAADAMRLALQELDLDAEWDPDAHDRQMADIYGGAVTFGANEQADDEVVDAEKPVWDDDIDIGDIVPAETTSKTKKKKKDKKKKPSDGNEDGVDMDAMDADVERGFDDEEWDGTEEMRKRVLDKYMDEVYGLEFNDLVRDACISLYAIADHCLIGRRHCNKIHVYPSPIGLLCAQLIRNSHGYRRRAEQLCWPAPSCAISRGPPVGHSAK